MHLESVGENASVPVVVHIYRSYTVLIRRSIAGVKAILELPCQAGCCSRPREAAPCDGPRGTAEPVDRAAAAQSGSTEEPLEPNL